MSYYNYYGVECFDLINLFLRPANHEEGFYLGNVIKYVYRAGLKDKENEINDIKKALDYFDRFFKIAFISNYEKDCKARMSVVKFITIMECFDNMPTYKKVFFLQLLYCAITGKWEELKEVYKTLQLNTEELEG